MRFLIVVATDVRTFHEVAESKDPPRTVAREVVRALRRRGHRFGEVRAVQVHELGEVLLHLAGRFDYVEYELERGS